MTAYTAFHVAISLIAIFTGFIVVYGMLNAQRMRFTTSLFLTTTIATSITGFGFKRDHIMPGHILGVMSLVLLAVALLALYRHQLVGRWRWIYVVTAVTSFYFNVFVLIVQLFQKVPALNALAPTGSEPPFAITQAAALLCFIVAGYFAVKKFHPVA